MMIYRVVDRRSVCISQDVVEDGNHMTFDYMALMAVASTIAGAGLLSDSPTAVIASMLGKDAQERKDFQISVLVLRCIF